MLELVVEKPCHHGFHIIWCISINGGYSGNLMIFLLRPSEQPLLQKGADAQDVRCDDAETNDHQAQDDRENDIDDEIVRIAL